MKPCTCGGKLYRHSLVQLKLTKEWKLKCHCQHCRTTETTYHAEKPVTQYQRNANGRPSIVEVAA